MSLLPIAVECERISVLLVGAGGIGLAKVRPMLEAGARVRMIAPGSSSPAGSLESENRVEILHREYAGSSDIADADIVIAATDSDELNRRIARDARALHRLVSVVTSRDEASFSSMAVHRVGPLAIGVTAGSVPGAAVCIRDAIAERFGDPYADAIAGAAELRSTVLRDSGSARWRELSARLFAPGFCDRVETGRQGEVLAACR